MCAYFRKNFPESAFMGRAASAVGLLLLSTLGAQAALFNLTKSIDYAGKTTFDIVGQTADSPTIPFSQYQGIGNISSYGAVVNHALILPSNAGSGSGVYRKLFGLDPDKDGVTSGYNRVVSGFDSKISNGFDPGLKISDLSANNGYYQFGLDINDGGNSTNHFLSLDDLQIYVGEASDPAQLPGTVATLGNLGVKVWDLQGNNTSGTKNRILSAGTGSGADDLRVLIPASLFAGFNRNSNVYLYSRLGELGVAGNDTGLVFNGFENTQFDEWSTLKSSDAAPVFTAPFSAVPEPSTALPLLCLMAAGLSRRSRGRVA